MIKIIGNDLYRAGEKIGYMDTKHVWGHDGKKLGYFDYRTVWGEDGRKLAFIDGDFLISYGASGEESKVRLETMNEQVEGGVMPGIQKCAVYVLLGE